jgi:hypothetical protein
VSSCEKSATICNTTRACIGWTHSRAIRCFSEPRGSARSFPDVYAMQEEMQRVAVTRIFSSTSSWLSSFAVLFA